MSDNMDDTTAFMQAPSYFDTDSDNESGHSSKGDGPTPSILSSDSDYNTQPGMPVEPNQPAQVSVYSPGHSFDEHYTLPKALLGGEGHQTGIPVAIPKHSPGDEIPAQLWEVVRGTDMKHRDEYWICDLFMKIQELQQEWQKNAHKGFMMKVSQLSMFRP